MLILVNYLFLGLVLIFVVRLLQVTIFKSHQH